MGSSALVSIGKFIKAALGQVQTRDTAGALLGEQRARPQGIGSCPSRSLERPSLTGFDHSYERVSVRAAGPRLQIPTGPSKAASA